MVIIAILEVYIHATGYAQATVRREYNKTISTLAKSQQRMPESLTSDTVARRKWSLSDITHRDNNRNINVIFNSDGFYVMFVAPLKIDQKKRLSLFTNSDWNSWANLSYDPTNGTDSKGVIMAHGKVAVR